MNAAADCFVLIAKSGAPEQMSGTPATREEVVLRQEKAIEDYARYGYPVTGSTLDFTVEAPDGTYRYRAVRLTAIS